MAVGNGSTTGCVGAAGPLTSIPLIPASRPAIASATAAAIAPTV